MPATWISQDSDFRNYIASLPAGKPVALDTEFEWTRTYYPRLALLQIATAENDCVLVDPFAISDWESLRDLLCDPLRTKIFFSGKNDLPILVRTCGGFTQCRPAAIHDLQIAMGFAGFSSNLSLKAVIEQLLGISLDKSETRSDWTQRPLSEQQLDYAAGDVALLPKAYLRIFKKLEENGNFDFFLEEMQLFAHAELYSEMNPAVAWKRIGGYHRLRHPLQLERLRALAAWREQTARALDLARNRLLPDDAMMRIVQAENLAPNDLMHLPRIHKAMVKRFQEQLLQLYAHPEETAPPELPEPRNPITSTARKRNFNSLVERILNLVAKRADARQIDPTLLGARHDAQAIAFQYLLGEPLHGRLFEGWRAALLQPTLAEILA